MLEEREIKILNTKLHSKDKQENKNLRAEINEIENKQPAEKIKKYMR